MLASFVAVSALISSGNINVSAQACSVVVAGDNNVVYVVGGACPRGTTPSSAPAPEKKKAKAPLVIDSEWSFSGTQNEIRYDGDIVFKPGGSITVANGAPLSIYAHTLKSEDSGKVKIVDTGPAGATGAKGRDGNGGGFEPGCRAVAEDHEGGRPLWTTGNHSDYIDANVACDHRDDSCDHGKSGGKGGAGAKGGMIDIYLDKPPNSVAFDLNLAGGPPGQGGSAGVGMRHKNGGEHHDCPSGAPGEPGQPGDVGACTMHVGAKTSPCG